MILLLTRQLSIFALTNIWNRMVLRLRMLSSSSCSVSLKCYRKKLYVIYVYIYKYTQIASFLLAITDTRIWKVQTLGCIFSKTLKRKKKTFSPFWSIVRRISLAHNSYLLTLNVSSPLKLGDHSLDKIGRGWLCVKSSLLITCSH